MSDPEDHARSAGERTQDPARAVNLIALEFLERAALLCEEEAAGFLSPEFATQQPLSSFAERFACGQCAKAIRDYALSLTEEAS